MDLTVCICTHDRPRYVRDCLDGLRGQTAPRACYNILIVDSASASGAAAQILALAGQHGARLIRIDQPGLALARNAAAWAARSRYVAFIGDDAIPAPTWVASILAAVARLGRPPALIGGRILPRWEAPPHHWWPAFLPGVLPVVEHEGAGEYRGAAVPPGLQPFAANMVVHVVSLLSVGGFGHAPDRQDDVLPSDEGAPLVRRLQDAGHSARYDSGIVVHRQIPSRRLRPEWLLSRLCRQGASTVLTHRLLRKRGRVWRELPRHLAVVALIGPAALLPRQSTRLLAARWRVAYAVGFVRAALGWNPAVAPAEAAVGVRTTPPVRRHATPTGFDALAPTLLAAPTANDTI